MSLHVLLCLGKVWARKKKKLKKNAHFFPSKNVKSENACKLEIYAILPSFLCFNSLKLGPDSDFTTKKKQFYL